MGANVARLSDTPLLDADESCLLTGDLNVAARRCYMINIKLGKTGGVTEAETSYGQQKTTAANLWSATW